MSRPTERALRHDNRDHEAFGAAMVACQGYSPACSDAGHCLSDGECFNPDPAWRAVRQIRAAAEGELSAGVAAGLRRAAALLAAELTGEPADDDEPGSPA